MAILVAVLLVLALFGLQRIYFTRHWFQRFCVSLKIQEKGVAVGESCELREIIRNEKRMPLPAVQVKFKTSKSFAFPDEGNASVTDYYYRSDVFCVGGRQQVSRTLKFRAQSRGYFTIDEIQAVVQDYFFSGLFARGFANETELYVYPRKLSLLPFEQTCRRIMGEVADRRSFLEDPLCFRGIRPYEPYDSMRQINWKSSAKNGELLVNHYDSSYSQEICILLNVNTHSVLRTRQIQEYSISIASTLANRFLREGVGVAVHTNARDIVTGESVRAERGMGNLQMLRIDRSLARIALDRPADAFRDVVERELQENSGWIQYILISSENSQEWMKYYEELQKRLPGLCQIVPQTQEEPPELAAGMIGWEVESFD